MDGWDVIIGHRSSSVPMRQLWLVDEYERNKGAGVLCTKSKVQASFKITFIFSSICSNTQNLVSYEMNKPRLKQEIPTQKGRSKLSLISK